MIDGFDDPEFYTENIAGGGKPNDGVNNSGDGDGADPDPTSRRKYRFRLVRFNDIELSSEPRCVVEDLIPRESLVVVWGPPKCGKSFVVFDLVMCVARGVDYYGRRVEQGIVVYIAAEGEIGIKARVAAYRLAHLSGTDEDPPFYLLTTRLDLVAERDQLISEIRAQVPDKERPIIIVIDTLNRTLNGSESKDQDMAAYRDAANTVQIEFHCAVILIHHCGVDATRPRGHTSLTGACDAQLAIKRDPDKTILLTLEWMKDGPEEGMLRFGLEPLEVGIDKNDKPITSCVVRYLDAPAQREARKKKLSPGQQRALDMLHEAIFAAGEIPPGMTRSPPGRRCVKEELWREYCYKGGISRGEGKDAKRKAWERASDTLIGDGVVGTWDGWVWVP